MIGMPGIGGGPAALERRVDSARRRRVSGPRRRTQGPLRLVSPPDCDPPADPPAADHEQFRRTALLRWVLSPPRAD